MVQIRLICFPIPVCCKYQEMISWRLSKVICVNSTPECTLLHYNLCPLDGSMLVGEPVGQTDQHDRHQSVHEHVDLTFLCCRYACSCDFTGAGSAGLYVLVPLQGTDSINECEPTSVSNSFIPLRQTRPKASTSAASSLRSEEHTSELQSR